MNQEAVFDPVSLEIMWSRLIGIADEMWLTIFRTAVSTIVGAAQDFGCEILDAEGRSLAHSNRSMPVFNIVMPTVIRAILRQFPQGQIQPHDVFITNDPWLCAGHLDDIAIVTPVFFCDRLVAFTMSVAHTSSIGGSLTSRTVRDVYEEGLRIPIVKLHDAGERNETVYAFVTENVRVPEMVLTDIEAQITANELGIRRVEAFLKEYRLADLRAIAGTIQDHSERAMRQSIGALPDGVYENEVHADGLDELVRLRCRVTIAGEDIHVDYTGSSPQQIVGGINCTMNYTLGHTSYPLKCLLCPAVPANDGTYRPVSVSAPLGSVLNCTPPVSVGSRTRVGWHVHPLLFGALESILPERVQAGNGLLHYLNSYGDEGDGKTYNAHFFIAGGRGAGQGRDGTTRNGFPSSARNVPVEIFELRAPLLIRRRALLPDSAGAGQWRGAFGSVVEVQIRPGVERPVSLFIDPELMRVTPPGLAGGDDGPLTRVTLNGHILSPSEIGSGQITLNSQSDAVEIFVPGGGGYGRRDQRDADVIAADHLEGLLTN